MADKKYAWSRILYGAEVDDKGNITGPLAIEINGDVSQDTIGASDEDWQTYMDDGVIRDVKMPESLQDPYQSPRQLMQQKLIDAQEGFNMSGPTADLITRFDDEGEVVPTETEEIKVATTPAAKTSAASNS